MPFLSLSFANFRNIASGTIDLLSREVYFVGDNGQGKSNILESLYLAAYGSSFRRAIFRDQKERTNSISIVYRDGKKRIDKNAKQIMDRKELVDTIPCVLFNHDDLDFATGSPDRKRFFIDQSLSMYDSSYIDLLRTFKKVLKTRNLVLKERNTGILDVLDAQLAESGMAVIRKRSSTIRDFNRVFARLYGEVSGIDNVNIEYSPSWKVDTPDKVLVQLAEKREFDLTMGTSMSLDRSAPAFVSSVAYCAGQFLYGSYRPVARAPDG